MTILTNFDFDGNILILEFRLEVWRNFLTIFFREIWRTLILTETNREFAWFLLNNLIWRFFLLFQDCEISLDGSTMYECYVCGTSTKAKDDMINHINAEHKRSKSVQKTPKPKLDKIGKENSEFCAIFAPKFRSVFKIFPSNEKKKTQIRIVQNYRFWRNYSNRRFWFKKH